MALNLTRGIFFGTGLGKLKSAVGNWQRSLRRVFKLANITHADGTNKRCHPHMFRDTFAVECLLAGIRLDQVSVLLGHKSIKITEKHYAPWVKERQEQLASTVRLSWPDFAGRKSKPRNSRKNKHVLRHRSSIGEDEHSLRTLIRTTHPECLAQHSLEH